MPTNRKDPVSWGQTSVLAVNTVAHSFYRSSTFSSELVRVNKSVDAWSKCQKSTLLLYPQRNTRMYVWELKGTVNERLAYQWAYN